MNLRRINPPTALFVVAMACSGVLLLVWQSHLTFFYDEWDPLLHRRGFNADILLRPHIDHILLTTTLFYKGIQATFGMASIVPYSVVSIGTFLLSVVLLFVYLRRRVDDWLALAGVLPVLFLGAAHEDLLWPFQIFFFGAMACGLGALLVLESGGRHRDAVACVLLSLGFTFSELSLPFVLGAGLLIVIERGPLKRAYVVAIPVLLYAAWYAGWGHTAPSYLSFHGVANSFSYVLDGMAAAVSSMLGLVPGGFVTTSSLGWGRPLLLALLLAAAIRIRVGGALPRSFWVSAVVLVSFWALTAANSAISRPPVASRYQYIGAILLLLVAADLATRVRLGRAGIAIAFAIAGLSLMGNLSLLHESYRALAGVTPAVRGGLSGLEIAADRVNPGLVLTQENSGFNYVGSITAGPYLSAVDAFGSPAYSAEALPAAPERARVSADKVLATALGLKLEPLPERPPTPPGAATPRLLAPRAALIGASRGCLSVSAADGVPVSVTVPQRGVTLDTAKSTAADVALRRFATESFPVSLGTVTGIARLAIPEDRSTRPWELQLEPLGRITICGE